MSDDQGLRGDGDARVRFSCAALVVALGVIPVAARGESQPLTLLYTGDSYGFCGRSERPGGFSRLANAVATVRAGGGTTLLVDNGNALGQLYYSRLDRGELIAGLMAELRYDAINVGLHELDYGRERLVELAADLPFVSTNVRAGKGEPWVPDHLLLERDGLRLLVLGVCDPRAPRLTGADGWQGLTLADPAVAVAEARAQYGAGVDRVILLANLDYPAAISLAHAVPGLDVVIARTEAGRDAYAHVPAEALRVASVAAAATPGGPTLVVTTSRYVDYVGRIDVSPEKAGLRPSVIELTLEAPVDPELRARIDGHVAALKQAHSRVLISKVRAALGGALTPAAMVERVLVALRDRAGSELAVIDRPALGLLEYTLGQINDNDAVREIDIQRLLWSGSHLVETSLTGAQLERAFAAGSDELWWLGLQRGDEGALLVNGRPLAAAELYSVATSSHLVSNASPFAELTGGLSHKGELSLEAAGEERQRIRAVILETFAQVGPAEPYPAQWRLDVDHLTFELGLLAVERDQAYPQIRDARASADDLFTLSGSGRLELWYDSQSFDWRTVLAARYVSVELAGEATNPKDRVRAASQIDVKAWQFLGFTPTLWAAYETELTAPADRSHRHLLRLVPGLTTTWDGIFLEMRLGPACEVDLSLAEPNLGLGAAFLSRLRQDLVAGVTLGSELELRYHPFFSVERNDTLPLTIDARLELAVEVFGDFHLTPYAELFLYQVGGGQGFGTNLTLGVGLTYRRLWKLATERFLR